MREIVGHPGDRDPTSSRFSSWSLDERAAEGQKAWDLLETLTRRILDSAPALRRLKDVGCTFELAVVQSIGTDDVPSSVGFLLTPELVAVLAELGASVYVDQYPDLPDDA